LIGEIQKKMNSNFSTKLKTAATIPILMITSVIVMDYFSGSMFSEETVTKFSTSVKI